MPHNKDILWKGLLEWVFDDLLRFIFPAADQLFSWQEPVVYMDKELAALVPGSADEMTARVVDKLVKVQLKKENSGGIDTHRGAGSNRNRRTPSIRGAHVPLL